MTKRQRKKVRRYKVVMFGTGAFVLDLEFDVLLAQCVNQSTAYMIAAALQEDWERAR